MEEYDLIHWTIIKIDKRSRVIHDKCSYFSHAIHLFHELELFGKGKKKHAHDTRITTADWRLSDKLFLIGLI